MHLQKLSVDILVMAARFVALMRYNSNARNAIPSRSFSFERENASQRARESLRDSEKLREALLCACAQESVDQAKLARKERSMNDKYNNY